MPRIFKGSESTLRLLISKTGDYQALTEIRIKLYTTDIENAIEIIDGIEVVDNIATITLAPRAFMGMEDGLINYIIDGATEDDVFHTERQSNYMLKTLSYINEDGVAEQTKKITANGEYRITPNDGLYVDISVNVEDVNGSYDEGYNVGYEQGKTDGVNEQISKLESINITENGTYTKEDGYNVIEVNVADLNGSYDEGYADGEKASFGIGYNQGQKDIAENARVLEVTKNGLYVSKYSEIPAPEVVTGVFDDGTEFYDYVELGGAAYDTKITATSASRIEMWYKGDNSLAGDAYNVIIGASESDLKTFLVRYNMFSNTDVVFRIGYEEKYHTWDENAWHHIMMSVEDGLWIDDIFIGKFGKPTFNLDDTFYINAEKNQMERNANGFYGMIKIDDVTIIPTKDGFLNKNTGELLELVKGGAYNFTNNTLVAEGELYKTVKVNMIPKIKMADYDLKFAYSSIKTVPEWADFSDITSMRNMFSDCGNLKTIPLIDTSKVTDMNSMFANCGSLIEVPELNTDSVESITGIFNSCYSLVSIPAINGEKIRISTWDPIFGYSNLDNLTDFGGFINLKTSISNDYSLTKVPNFSYQSCINILNGLYDFVGNGETPSSDQGQLKVHPNFLDKVGEEIVIGTNKGWTITA